MRGTVSDDSGAQHRVSRIWVSDDAGARHEVVRAWVGDSQGVPRIWFDKDAVLKVTVTATPLDYQSVRLAWALGPQGETALEYKVYRDGVLVQTLAGTATTWTDTGLTSGTTYSYRVDATVAGSPVISGTASATTDTYIPPATVQLFATPANYITVNLSWTVTGADSFTVKRGTTVLATSGTSYVDTGLTPGTWYTYTLTAKKAGAADAVATRTVMPANYPAFSLSAAPASYVQNNLSWTALPAGWSYNIKRDGTSIYSGTNTSFSDTGLAGGTTYGYVGEAIWSGAVRRSSSASATTTAWPGFSMSASDGAAWNNIEIRCTDLGSGWTYYLASSWGDIGWIGTTYNHSVGESSSVNYRIDAYWGGALRLQAWDSGSSSARPVSTGYAATTNGRANTSGGWCETTKYTPSGGSIAFPYSGTMTRIDIGVWGYSGSNARIRPIIGGVARQDSIVGPSSYSADGYNHLSGCGVSVGFAAGTHSVGMRVGGSEPAEGINSFGRAEWRTWTPYSNWQTQVYVAGVSYSYYPSRAAVEESRSLPWWREELADAFEDRELHVETWGGPDGFEKAVVTDKETGEVLVDWERED